MTAKEFLIEKIVELILFLTVVILLAIGVTSGAIELSETPEYDSIGLTIAIDDLTRS
ncbi:hypothetical protein [uncultured Roseibium sp.]|uniref:hypothetical protein n=1 Tax=uncultured Roseibium sp. TaxID=1936171 RepID=UPI002625F215|nr:hypothetical protein [uncultured Roseibium sp.]